MISSFKGKNTAIIIVNHVRKKEQDSGVSMNIIPTSGRKSQEIEHQEAKTGGDTNQSC